MKARFSSDRLGTHVWKVLEWGVLLFAILRILSLDLSFAVTNDGLFYLGRAMDGSYFEDPMSILAPKGLKTAGYAIFLTILKPVGALFGATLIESAAITNRLILLGAVVAVWAWLRLYSAPALLFLSSAPVVAHSTFVLNECFTLGLGLVLIFALRACIRYRPSTLGFWLGASMLVIATLGLVLTKFNLVVLLGIGLPVMVVAVRGGVPYRPAAGVVAVAGLLAGGYLVNLSVRNAMEYGRPLPTVAVGRAFYWGAYYATFSLRPENRAVQSLKTYFERGSMHPAVGRIERQCGRFNFNCSNPELMTRSRDMLKKANIGLLAERARSFLMAMAGGEKEELRGARRRLIKDSGTDRLPPERFFSNYVIRQDGFEAFIKSYNHGRSPWRQRMLNVVPGNRWHPLWLQLPLWLISLVAALAAARRCGADRRIVGRLSAEWVVLGTVLAIQALFALSISIYLCDIWRYLITPFAFVLVVLAVVSAGRASELTGTR